MIQIFHRISHAVFRIKIHIDKIVVPRDHKRFRINRFIRILIISDRETIDRLGHARHLLNERNPHMDTRLPDDRRYTERRHDRILIFPECIHTAASQIDSREYHKNPDRDTTCPASFQFFGSAPLVLILFLIVFLGMLLIRIFFTRWCIRKWLPLIHFFKLHGVPPLSFTFI